MQGDVQGDVKQRATYMELSWTESRTDFNVLLGVSKRTVKIGFQLETRCAGRSRRQPDVCISSGHLCHNKGFVSQRVAQQSTSPVLSLGSIISKVPPVSTYYPQKTLYCVPSVVVSHRSHLIRMTQICVIKESLWLTCHPLFYGADRNKCKQ